MSKPIDLDELMAEPGIVGAVAWSAPTPGIARGAPPRLDRYVGFQNPTRAERLMMTAEAVGLSITAVLHLEAEHRPEFRTTELPVDSVVIHGHRYSIVVGLGRTAALIDNTAGYNINSISRKLALVASSASPEQALSA